MTDPMIAGAAAPEDAPPAPPIEAVDTDAPARAWDTWEVQLGLDMVCGSLNVLSALLGESETAAVKHSELGYLMWLIEEKAGAVRNAVRSKIASDGVQFRSSCACSAEAREGHKP